MKTKPNVRVESKTIKNTAAVYQDLQAETSESIFQKLWQNFQIEITDLSIRAAGLKIRPFYSHHLSEFLKQALCSTALVDGNAGNVDDGNLPK